MPKEGDLLTGGLDQCQIEMRTGNLDGYTRKSRSRADIRQFERKIPEKGRRKGKRTEEMSDNQINSLATSREVYLPIPADELLSVKEKGFYLFRMEAQAEHFGSFL